MAKSRHRTLARSAVIGDPGASDVEWVVDRRRTVGAVWSGWQAQDRASPPGRGDAGNLACARDFPLKGGTALVSSTDSTDVARATALARSAGGDSV
jgi:hypothetical protein